MNNNERVVMISGGLSGIGKAAVLEAAKKQYQIVIFDIQDDKADEVLKQCEQLGAKAEYYHCDVMNPESVDKAFQYIADKYGRLDCAFNNVGSGHRHVCIDALTDEEIEKSIQFNLMGTIYCIKREVAIMKEQKYGRIVNTASSAGILAAPGQSIYGAAKHGIIGLTQAVALEYVRDGITVNAVAPGATHTEFMDRMKTEQPPIYELSMNINPARRLARPFDLAHAVMFLFEEESEFINGVTLPVDSGLVVDPHVPDVK